MPGLIFPFAFSAHLKASFGINKNKEDKRKQNLASAEAIHWSQSLEKLLASSSGLSVFETFLQSEHSEENLEFWVACEDFKKTEALTILISKAEAIYKEFIQEESLKEINIDFQTRNDIKMNIKDPHPFCFDNAQKIVYRLMERGPYLRFLKSDTYLNLINMPESKSRKS
ncbi:regulator of G-protein signaling 1-like [Protopterus annectens]|uniref:regulator of G-protein signaling 1-like n=1 Tax=Protopterus annectens TaxID=7888 RepID=UPI001CFC1F19|nr:regulator of G-protein signaling 1-like [Protopterus annectens]